MNIVSQSLDGLPLFLEYFALGLLLFGTFLRFRTESMRSLGSRPPQCVARCSTFERRRLTKS